MPETPFDRVVRGFIRIVSPLFMRVKPPSVRDPLEEIKFPERNYLEEFRAATKGTTEGPTSASKVGLLPPVTAAPLPGVKPEERATELDKELFTLEKLQGALQGLEIHLPLKCRIDGKPCECCDKHAEDVDLYSHEETNYCTPERRPFYEQLSLWGIEVARKDPEGGGMTDEEYQRYGDQARDFRLYVQAHKKEVLRKLHEQRTEMPATEVSEEAVIKRAQERVEQIIREAYQEEGSPRLIGPTKREKEPPPEELEYFADSPDQCAQTIEGTGLRSKLDASFQEAITRAKRAR